MYAISCSSAALTDPLQLFYLEQSGAGLAVSGASGPSSSMICSAGPWTQPAAAAGIRQLIETTVLESLDGAG